MAGIPDATTPKTAYEWATMLSWRSWLETSRVNLFMAGRTRSLASWISPDPQEQRPPRVDRITKGKEQNREPQRYYSPSPDQPVRAKSSVADASHTEFPMESVQRLPRMVRRAWHFCLAGNPRGISKAL